MRTVLVLSLSLMLSACGQKGALYLPETETADVTQKETAIANADLSNEQQNQNKGK